MHDSTFAERQTERERMRTGVERLRSRLLIGEIVNCREEVTCHGILGFRRHCQPVVNLGFIFPAFHGPAVALACMEVTRAVIYWAHPPVLPHIEVASLRVGTVEVHAVPGGVAVGDVRIPSRSDSPVDN